MLSRKAASILLHRTEIVAKKKDHRTSHVARNGCTGAHPKEEEEEALPPANRCLSALEFGSISHLQPEINEDMQIGTGKLVQYRASRRRGREWSDDKSDAKECFCGGNGHCRKES